MLNLFRINDPFRLILVFLMLVLLRIPIFFADVPLSLPELNLMLVGEGMVNGKILYAQIWEHISPLTAFIFKWINAFFGRSHFVNLILASLLVFYQALIFNQILSKSNVFTERTYIPAFLYVLFASSHQSLLILSPTLLGLTLLLHILKSIFNPNKKVRDFDIFKLGLLLGILLTLHISAWIFVVWALVSLSIFRGLALRQYLLIMHALSFPLAVVVFNFYINDALGEMYASYLSPILNFENIHYTDYLTLILVLIVPLLIAALGAFKVLTYNFFVNFQAYCQQTMLFWFLAALFTVVFSYRVAPFQMMLFVPPFVFFATHKLLLMPKKWLAELLFLLLISASVAYYLNSIYEFVPLQMDKSKNMLLKEKSNFIEKDKTVLVLGTDLSPYQYNSLASPYLNWKISQNHFSKLDYYQIVLKIHQNIEQDKPQIIVDEFDYMEKLLEKMPILKKKYQQSKSNSKLYYRIAY